MHHVQTSFFEVYFHGNSRVLWIPIDQYLLLLCYCLLLMLLLSVVDVCVYCVESLSLSSSGPGVMEDHVSHDVAEETMMGDREEGEREEQNDAGHVSVQGL